MGSPVGKVTDPLINENAGSVEYVGRLCGRKVSCLKDNRLTIVSLVYLVVSSIFLASILPISRLGVCDQVSTNINEVVVEELSNHSFKCQDVKTFVQDYNGYFEEPPNLFFVVPPLLSVIGGISAQLSISARKLNPVGSDLGLIFSAIMSSANAIYFGMNLNTPNVQMGEFFKREIPNYVNEIITYLKDDQCHFDAATAEQLKKKSDCKGRNRPCNF